MQGVFESNVDGYLIARHQSPKFYVKMEKFIFGLPEVLYKGEFKCKSVYKKTNHSENYVVDVPPSSFNYFHCNCKKKFISNFFLNSKKLF